MSKVFNFANEEHLYNACCANFRKRFNNIEDWRNLFKILSNNTFLINKEYRDVLDKYYIADLNCVLSSTILFCEADEFSDKIEEFNNILHDLYKLLKDNIFTVSEMKDYLRDIPDNYFTNKNMLLGASLDLSIRNKLNEFIDIQINSEDLETGYKKSGIYRIYNQNNRIIYIGKSTSDLADRLRTSIREQFQKGNSMPYFYDYAIIDNKSDVDIFEVYYISLFKPCNNSANIYTDMPSIVLPELNFTDLKEIKYTKEKEGL